MRRFSAVNKLTAYIAVSLVCLYIGEPAFSQTDDVDAYIEEQIKMQRIPGLSLAVVKEGRIVKAKGYGFANLELRAPAKPNTLYGLGSISKQFTATSIMLLVELAQIGLDIKIAHYLDGLPNEWTGVTVRHLLSHTSGLKEEVWTGGIVEFDRHEHRQEEIIKTAFGPLKFEPGDKFAYSNVGYRLLGMIIEKASGQSYWKFLDEHIFKPLGMNATRNSDPKTIIPNRAKGYGRSGDSYVNRDPVTASSAFSEGALMSSVLDMAKWDAALYSTKILKKSSLKKMWTPIKLNDGTPVPYGFGWEIADINGHTQIGHGGGLPGFVASISRFVDDKLTVIVLTNCEGTNLRRIALGIAGFYVPGVKPQNLWKLFNNDLKR